MNYTSISFSKNKENKKNSTLSARSEIELLKRQLKNTQLPTELLEKGQLYIQRIEMAIKYNGNIGQLEVITKYIDWITSLPWSVVTAGKLDIEKAKQAMDKNHYGLAKTKQRVLEYLSVLILQSQKTDTLGERAPILFFVGLAGTGKTTFARSVAEALGRKFARIPFGGLSSAYDLRGVSKVNPEAEPGLIIKALRRIGSRNAVILLDELDRINPEVRGSIMGVLLELLDPEQNDHFIDHYVDFPFDLSKIIFIGAANNTRNVSTAVLDRLEVIQMPSYTDAEKVIIARDYILPKLLLSSGLEKKSINISEEVWKHIARLSGYDPGIRSVERKVESIVRKISYKIVSGNGKNFVIDEKNMKEYLD